MQTSQQKFNPVYKIYRAKTNGGGVASQFELDRSKKAVWFSMAPQLDKAATDKDAKFDWKNNKLSVKLGLVDIGELLAVLDRKQSGVGPQGSDGKHKGLFHRNKTGCATVSFAFNDSGILYIGIGIKKKSDNVKRLYHSVSNGEAAILRVLLRQAVLILTEWL